MIYWGSNRMNQFVDIPLHPFTNNYPNNQIFFIEMICIIKWTNSNDRNTQMLKCSNAQMFKTFDPNAKMICIIKWSKSNSNDHTDQMMKWLKWSKWSKCPIQMINGCLNDLQMIQWSKSKSNDHSQMIQMLKCSNVQNIWSKCLNDLHNRMIKWSNDQMI